MKEDNQFTSTTSIRPIPVWLEDFFEKANGAETSSNKLQEFVRKLYSSQNEYKNLVDMASLWSLGSCNSKEDGNQTLVLQTIFNKINDGKHNKIFPLKPLNIETNACFPVLSDSLDTNVVKENYRCLWNGFMKEFKFLPEGSVTAFSESLFYLLKKYTWSIPAKVAHNNSASLFEYIKITAAFADCLYCYKETEPESFFCGETQERLSLRPGYEPVILLGGDISGIQSFIYNIASRKAAVSLKGRSLYLQLLIDAAIHRLLTHVGIKATQSHIVYSSGGKFYMLLPNIECVKDALLDLQTVFEKELWEKHSGQLIFNMAYTPFAFYEDTGFYSFEGSDLRTIGSLWKNIADKLSDCKNRKFNSIVDNNFDKLFNPEIIHKGSGKVKVCSVTGIESDKCVKIDNDDEDSPFVLPLVKQQVDLGNALKDADFIFMHASGGYHPLLKANSQFFTEVFGVKFYLFNKKKIDNIHLELDDYSYVNDGKLQMVNNMNFLSVDIRNHFFTNGFLFYGGNQQAQVSNGKLKTFEELASDTYLGILRMDVDGLGSIFIKGLPENERSFTSYATLSFLLDTFFCGYLNTIRSKFENEVNIIYSGGDDVFAVGKWNKLLEFSKMIRAKFAEFVGRDDISISGGIVLVGEKFPIAKAAQLAGKAEDKAKEGTKNQINIFWENVSWDKEFNFVETMKDNFVDLITNLDTQMPRSILFKLMQLCGVMRNGDMSYLWHTAYYLKRFSSGKKEEVSEFCTKLLTECLSKRRNYELIAVAARWAELETRKHK